MIAYPPASSTSFLTNSDQPTFKNLISCLPFDFLSTSQVSLDKENQDLFPTNGKQGQLCQPQRNLFQNLTNREPQLSLCRKRQSLSFAKKISRSLAKPTFLKSSSILTRDSETSQPRESLFLPFEEEKNPSFLLAEQLENKVKEMDMKITERLKEIKEEFWQTRRRSHKSFENRRSLLKHLNRKPSEASSPQQLKLLFLKIIPLSEIIGPSGDYPTNSRILQGKITSRLRAQQSE